MSPSNITLFYTQYLHESAKAEVDCIIMSSKQTSSKDKPFDLVQFKYIFFGPFQLPQLPNVTHN